MNIRYLCRKDANEFIMKLKYLFGAALMATTLSVGQAEPGKHLSPELLLSMARVGDAALSPNGKTVVYALSQPSVKDNNSRSELYTVNMDGTARTQITATKSNEYAPQWIEGGARIAFMSNETGSMQLFSMRPDGSDKKQITDIEGGIEGFRFSPDGKQIAFVHQIKYGKTTKDLYPDLDKATGRVINQLMYKHWDEWVETIPHIFVASLGNEPIKEGKDILEGEPYEAPMKPHSGIEDFAWSPDSKSIAYASRKKEGLAYTLSTNSDIYLYDLASGKTRNLTEGMMGYDTHPTFSPDGRYIAWISMEHDGYESDLKRLFVQDLKTGTKSFLTDAFEYDVDAMQWRADNKGLYFLSCVKAEKNIFEVDVRTHKVRQITSGQHNYVSLQVEAGQMLAGRQSMLVPTDLYQVNIKTGEAKAITQENAALLASLDGSPTVEKRWIKTTDGGNMLTWVVYPPHFDKSKQYPALLYCQGGPQSTISQYFSYRWNARLMAEQGYIVIMPNRHGVPSFGKKWNEQISGDYSGQNIQDYLVAVDTLKKEPFINPKAIGAVGASYGGYSVYYLAGHHEGRFSAFVAHAGIFNLEMQYMTTEEMWFANWDMGGAPWDKDNKTAQRTFANSPHKAVGAWDTPILITHGEKDFRIMAEQGQAAFNAAQMRGIPSQMLIYPDENHWILRPQNSLLWQRTFYGWLDKWLKK